MASVGRTLRRWTVFRSLPLSPYSCGRTVVRMSSTRMVRLDSRRLLRVVGEDKGSVLQGLVTNDLTTSQSVQYTMLLNPQVQRLRTCVRMCVCACVHVYTCIPVFVGWSTNIRLFSVTFSSSPSPGEGTVRGHCVQGGSRSS